MFHRLRKWFGKETALPHPQNRSIAWVPQSDFPVHPRSNAYPYDPFPWGEDCNSALLPPGIDPRVLFPLLRRLRDYVPDISAGVWAWVRLCSTPQSFSLSDGDETEQQEARRVLAELDRRIFELHHDRERGVEALTQCFFLSVFTYGSFCGEVVLHESRRWISRFVVIDPATIRFKLDPQTRRLHPYQVQGDGSLVALHSASFFYFGLDTDGLSPYGRSPLLALPLVVKLQQQLLQDMAKAQHNAGYPTIHFRIASPERMHGESISQYHERLQKEITGVKDEIQGKQADSNLITYDNIEVRYVGPGGNTLQWSESIQVVSEQVISALHLAPFMLGRNWGTTESWGTAQYQLLTNNAKTVQEGAKRLAEWIRNLELILHGSPATVTHYFAPHHHLDVFDRARAFKTSAETLIQLTEKGLMESSQAKQRLETLLRFL